MRTLRGTRCIVDLDAVVGWRIREYEAQWMGQFGPEYRTKWDVAAYIGVESFSVRQFDTYAEAEAEFEICVALWREGHA